MLKRHHMFSTPTVCINTRESTRYFFSKNTVSTMPCDSMSYKTFLFGKQVYAVYRLAFHSSIHLCHTCLNGAISTEVTTGTTPEREMANHGSMLARSALKREHCRAARSQPLWKSPSGPQLLSRALGCYRLRQPDL